jgi:hypothetical protein
MLRVIPVKNGKETIAIRVNIIGEFQCITLTEIDYILVNKYVKRSNVNGKEENTASRKRRKAKVDLLCLRTLDLDGDQAKLFELEEGVTVRILRGEGGEFVKQMTIA